MDGGGGGEIEYQNFNAASAQVRITGRSVHPGSAKNVMLNAQKLAMEFHALLPPDESPEKTAGLEGFYHLIHMEGTTGSAALSYILRDHDAARLEEKKLRMREGADLLNRKYGPGTVKLTLQDSYRNMEEIIRRNPVLIRMAEEAARKAKLSPRILPIRGGTRIRKRNGDGGGRRPARVPDLRPLRCADCSAGWNSLSAYSSNMSRPSSSAYFSFSRWSARIEQRSPGTSKLNSPR